MKAPILSSPPGCLYQVAPGLAFSVSEALSSSTTGGVLGDLPGARVYKRNYAKNLMNSVLHSKVAKAKDGAFTMLANDAVSTAAKDEPEASVNAALSAIGDDAPTINVGQGLVLLSDERSKYSDPEARYPLLDIVAIPGLIEEPLQTWTRPQTGHFWLKDSLPTEFVSARIFTFNYPSYLLLIDKKAHMKLYAEKLLSDLETAEAGKDDRKLIFLAHSYGGFLVKKGLVLAENDMRYSDIVRNTLLVCLLGTPEVFDPLTSFTPPLDLGYLVDLYLEGLGVTRLKGSARRSLLETLTANTGCLSHLTDAFNKFEERQTKRSFPSMHLCKFYERDAPISIERTIDEKVLPANRSLWRGCGSHTELCQFEDEEDVDYQWLVLQIMMSSYEIAGFM